MSEIPKKKRGRKPKNKIVNTKEITSINKDNKIICVKINDNMTNTEEEILPGFVSEEFQIKNNQCIHCWNCTSKLDKFYKSIPIKYINEIFYIYGYFCNISCSIRYLYDTFSGKDLWTKYELFNFYCSKTYGENITLKPAPDKLTLQIFGGNLTIEEYKKDFINYNEINIPPIIPLSNPNLKYESNKLNEKSGELKLYRKKTKKNTEGILENMKL